MQGGSPDSKYQEEGSGEYGEGQPLKKRGPTFSKRKKVGMHDKHLRFKNKKRHVVLRDSSSEGKGERATRPRSIPDLTCIPPRIHYTIILYCNLFILKILYELNILATSTFVVASTWQGGDESD